MKPSLHSNAVVQALVACRARREVQGTPHDSPDARQRVKTALWAQLESRLGSYDPARQTLAQWALEILSVSAGQRAA